MQLKDSIRSKPNLRDERVVSDHIGFGYVNFAANPYAYWASANGLSLFAVDFRPSKSTVPQSVYYPLFLKDKNRIDL